MTPEEALLWSDECDPEGIEDRPLQVLAREVRRQHAEIERLKSSRETIYAELLCAEHDRDEARAEIERLREALNIAGSALWRDTRSTTRWPRPSAE